MILKFRPAKPGETTDKIVKGQQFPVDGFLESEDKTVSMPMLSCMSDWRWQWLCFIDRLFHPQKNAEAFGEDVPKVIERMTQWFIDHAPEEIREETAAELEELKTYVAELEDEYKPAAEIYLREIGKRNSRWKELTGYDE